MSTTLDQVGAFHARESKGAEFSSLEFMLRRLSRPSFYINAVRTLLDRSSWADFYREVGSQAERRGPDFTIVQIGANDGVRNDPVNRIIRNFACKALLVEPVPRYFGALKDTYADFPNVQLANVAIDDTEGTARMFAVTSPDDRPTRMQGLSSFHPEIIEQGAWVTRDMSRLVTEINVPTRRLGTLLAAHEIEGVDLFVADTEGHDAVVVNQLLDLDMPAAPLVLYEHCHLSREDNMNLTSRLMYSGYDFVKLKRDTIAFQG